MQSRTIIVYPILGIPWSFFQTFAIKNSVPQGNFRAGPFLGEKETWHSQFFRFALIGNGERRKRKSFDGGRARSSQYHKPRRHLLLNGSVGNTGQRTCLLFSKGERLPLGKKQAERLFFYKMEGRDCSLPGTDLFDCAELHGSIFRIR